MIFPEIRAFALTVSIGAAGAVIAGAIAFPAPLLIGPAVAVAIAALCGLKLAIPVRVRNACFIMVGISMGATVTPDVLVAAQGWPLSFLMVVVSMILLVHVSSVLLQKAFGFDRITALLSSCPGHFTYVLSLAAELRCNARTVSMTQSVRVLLLTITTPLIVEGFDLAKTGNASAAAEMNLLVFGAIVLASALVGSLFTRWKFPAALMLGGAAVSIVTHATGIVGGAVPFWVLVPVYVVLGSMIGTRFSGVTLAEIRSSLVAGCAVTLTVTVMAAAVAYAVSYFLGIPLDAALIAFAPGGLETMSAMAVMLDADPAYVGTHHVLRLIFLSVWMPFLLGRSDGRPQVR